MENSFNWDEEFTRWKNSNLEIQSSDSEFTKLSRSWMQKSVDLKFSYQFEWLGIPIIQLPTDLIIFQEIIWKTRPDLIIETGIARGGSINFWASMQDLCGIDGNVIGIDIEIRDHAKKAIAGSKFVDRISLIEGNSIDKNTIAKIEKMSEKHQNIMVVLDSNHTHEHVYQELELYAHLVTKGCYLLVLDTVIDDLTIDPNRSWGPDQSPKSAVNKFMSENQGIFQQDKVIESKATLTVAPNGFWYRK